MKKNLTEAAMGFNYLSGIKDLSIMKEDLNEEINLTPEQDKELLDIILKYVKDSDDAEAIIQDYIDGETNRPDIQDGDFANEFEAWKKKHNIKGIPLIIKYYFKTISIFILYIFVFL